MKKFIAFMVAMVMVISLVPVIAHAGEITSTVSASRAFSWNFDTNAQNGTLPTSVSWGNYRACFMNFELPGDILAYKDKDVIVTATLSASMTFNNGRKSGQAPFVTIIEADGDSISSVSLTGGSATTGSLKAAWENGTVLGSIDTLAEDVSSVMDITSVVKSGKKNLGLYLTCREEDGYLQTNGIVNFNSPSLTITAVEVTGDYYLESLNIPYNLEDGYKLPDSVSGQTVTWNENEIVAESETVYKTLTATINGKSKDFDVMIMGKDDNFIAAYTKSDSVAVGNSMHLAVKTENGWTPLNFDIGVLFEEADLDNAAVAGTTRVLDKPYLYRKDNGKIGVAAKCKTVDGVEDEFLTLWETEDLVHFEKIGTTQTLTGFENTERVLVDGIDNVSCVLPVTDSEYEYVTKKLGEVTNTGVEKIEITTPLGTKVETLPNLIANYSDTSTAEIPVEWNMDELNAIDFTKPGKYTVTGEAAVSEYKSPMIYGTADPVIYKYNGKYYFIATNETGGQVDLYIRSADTIEALAEEPPVLIFEHTSSGDHSGCNWAPELHEINGELYCLFASSTTGSWNAVQSRIMKCTGDPMNKVDWEAPVRVTRKDGTALTTGGITLDMTYFEADGKYYYCWAERPITSSGNGNSSLVIATMDPSDPYKITSDPVVIYTPSYGWDRRTSPIAEGPYVLKHDGKLYMTFSGSGVNDTYCTGLLTAEENGDLLNPESWKVTGYPVISSEHVAGENGPGHNSFVKDEYGRDVVVLHMKPNGGTRSTTARTIHYAFDGTPIFYMTSDRYLKEEYRKVTAEIYVKDDSMSDEEFKLWTIANNLKIHNADNIKGHITLPLEIDGAKVEWASNNAAITNDGIVTRGTSDVTVVLTATVSMNGKSVEREIDVTVKAKSEEKEKVGYIYAYFRGSVNGEKEVQQIHLAISEDGLNWKDLNGNFPVIESTMGTKGLRDPYIIRSYEGDKFYLMATDLDANGGAWTQYGTNGSKSLMFWESDDLVNWSEQRMIQVSDETMGCTWAPEAIYDEENKEYIIYWSSHREDLGGKKVVQCAKTRDFVTFTEPEIFVGGDSVISVIDTTMIKGDDGKYYRFTKYADKVRVFMEVADSPTGPFNQVDSNVDDIYGVEGPAIFKLPDGRYCLMLDSYTGDLGAIGFFPMVTDDLASGQFTRLTSGYKMPTGAKHGVMIAVTQEEYDAVMDKWGPLPDDENVIEYKFDGADENLTLYGNAKVENGALVLNGTTGTYASLGNGIFDRRENYTISMDVLSNMESGFFFTYAVGTNTSDYQFLRIRGNHVRLAQTISGNSYEKQVNYVPEVDFNDDWHNYTIVGEYDKMTLYIDGEMVGEVDGAKTLYHLGNNLHVTLGKSTFSGDLYFNGSFDNVKIYNRALTQAEVVELNGADKLFDKDVEAISFLNPHETTADLMLPKVGSRSGAVIEWKSSDEKVITNNGVITRGEENKTATMTATITLGERKETRTFDFTVLKKEEDYAYLFVYFTGNAASQERLFYGVSKDGYNFRALNGGNSVLTSDLGTGCIRDPFIMKGEDGYYYIIATDMKSSLGWSSNYATVVYKTPDLINIVDKEWINYREIEGAEDCTRAWAPQAIWCPEKNAYMVYITMAIPGDPYPTVMYRHYATDLCDASTYTALELMLDEPFANSAAIDGDIVYDKFHNEYIMYYDGKRIATSDILSGTWTHAETKYDDGQLPMVTSGGVSMAVEGSNIWQIIGEDKWVIAADGSSFNGGCYALVETTDFENYTQLWESNGDYSFDFTPRHGYVIPISERELNNLFDKYGSVELEDGEPEVYDLSIDVNKKGVDINEDMYGIFYEDINYAADGGLYSEVIENRSFEAAHCNPDKGEVYTKIPDSGWTTSNAVAEYLTENPLNENNTTYIRLTTNEGSTLSNACYSGFKVTKEEVFDVSFFARGDYKGKITVSIVEGDDVLGSKEFAIDGNEFTKYAGTLMAKADSSSATIRISFDAEGTVDMDMLSVMSQDTFNGRNNGLRRDIVQALYNLHPAFMRFPGGCVAEGYYLDNRYNWKDSIGPVEERKENWNRWQTGSNAYDYCQTLGLGFYEYFLLCEDIGAKALPVVSVGIACQYQSGEYSSWEDLYNIYIQDAIDLIEFANGDPETNEWAAIRAEMGHPEPFNLEYLGIGNEQWYTVDNRFFERYEAFEEEIHALYPDIKLIATSGPSADGTHYENAWNWLETHKGEENFTYAVDEHYYRTPEWFLENINRYDTYDREGFAVYAGEYAANGTYGNTLYAALAEAAYMTGLERNADIVKMASYAPLLAKNGYTQWSPNLIWFDNTTVYGTPDYYVQKMYSENNGSYTVENTVTVQGEEKVYNIGVGTWSTSAQFKDITVTDNTTGNVTTVELNNIVSGTWSEEEGVYTQTSTTVNGAFNIAPVSCDNYTLSLKAMKTGGNEGFLIPVQYVDENNYIFWNIAGWSNTKSAVQSVSNGAKTTITSSVDTTLDSNVWYDVEVKISDNTMYCYLDGKLVQSVYIKKTEGPVYSTVSVDEESGDIIVKLVNTGTNSVDVNINIQNADYIAPEADEIVLTGNAKGDKNSLTDPENMVEVKGTFVGVSENFCYTMDALSFVVLRLHTKESYVTKAEEITVNNPDKLPETVTVTLSDNSQVERAVMWKKATAGAYFYGGTYTVEGDIEGTNLKAIATLNVPTHGTVEFTGDNTALIYTREEALVRIAVYNNDDALVSVKTEKVTGEKEVIFTVPQGGKVKIMLWSENMTPLEETFEKTY